MSNPNSFIDDDDYENNRDANLDRTYTHNYIELLNSFYNTQS